MLWQFHFGIRQLLMCGNIVFGLYHLHFFTLTLISSISNESNKKVRIRSKYYDAYNIRTRRMRGKLPIYVGIPTQKNRKNQKYFKRLLKKKIKYIVNLFNLIIITK